MTWIARLTKPGPVIVDESWGIITDEQLHVYSVLCVQRKFFSASYFYTIEQILTDRFMCGLLTNTIENCFDFLEHQRTPDIIVTKDIMLMYAGLDNEYSISVLKEQLNVL